MRRPAVLHCVRTWGVPSERFVRDLVATTSATRPFVACGVRVGMTESSFPIWTLTHAERWTPPALEHRRHVVLLAAAGIRSRASLLHAHFGHRAVAVARVAEFLHRPWVLSLHGRDLLVELPPMSLAPRLATAALVVTPSRFLADAAADYGFDDHRIRVISSGVKLEDYEYRACHPDPDGTITVTFAGRFVAKKGVLDAARALADVQRRHPHARGLFVGYGPLEEALRGLLRANDTRAEIVDGRPERAVARALARTHIVLTPSRTGDDGDADTLSVVNLEAQACGIPVLTTRHGGIPEAVATDSAVLVGEGDGPGLSAALEELVTHPERWPAMGAAGRRHVALNFELGARTAEMEEQYSSILATGRPSAQHRTIRPEWPRVSVVIPAHNRRELLESTLSHLRQQTYPTERLEVVVIDSGSNDNTSELLARAPTSPNLVTHRIEVNESAADARNVGIELASGDIVAFTDSDCRPTPTWLEALVAGFDDDVDLVQGRTSPDPEQPYTALSRSLAVPFEYGLYETCNIGYRIGLLKKVDQPPFDGALADDMRAMLGQRLGKHAFGEDVDLAWRAKRLGGRSRFAATAVVHHHVFPPDTRYLLERAALVAGFPLLVARYPELRDRFLFHRVFLSSRRPRIVLATAGAILGCFDRRFLILAAPYFSELLAPRDAWRARLKRAAINGACDAIETVSLAYGSIRAGTPVV